MKVNSLASKINRLPESKRQEVADFVEFLESRFVPKSQDAAHTSWHDREFENMSIMQAMRGMEDESDSYTDEDLKEHWL